MEQAGSVIHSTFAIDVIQSGGYEGARNECKKSEIHRGIEVVHFAVSVLIAKVVTLRAQEQEATIRLFEDYSGEIVNGSKHVGFTWNLTEPRVTDLIFQNGSIYFENNQK